MGNKSYAVNPDVLRQLRRERGWSQYDAGCELDKLKRPGSKFGIDPKRIANDYQRIERRGSTSLKTLDALASMFRVDKTVLEGREIPSPVEYVEQVRLQLQQAIDQGENETLKKYIQQSTSQNPDVPPANILGNFAQNIASQIERAQLTCNSMVLKELAHQTGIPAEELVRPANTQGYWLCTVSVHNTQFTQIVHGWPTIKMLIPEFIGMHIKGSEADTSIRVYRDSPWYRIEVTRPMHRGQIHIEIVRCQPDSKGLRWQKTIGLDEWIMESELTAWANTTSNFVEVFDEPICPSDFRNLRFRVTEFNDLLKDSALGQKVIYGNLNEIPAPLIESVHQSGKTHQIALNWLSHELSNYLRPLVTEFPASWWNVTSGSHIDISLWAHRPAVTPTTDRCYQIELVEEVTPGKFVIAPFREEDRATLQDSIQTWRK